MANEINENNQIPQGQKPNPSQQVLHGQSARSASGLEVHPNMNLRAQERVPKQGAAGANMNAPKQPGKSSGKRTVLIVAGIILIAIVVWVLVWLFACNGSSLIDPSAQTGQAPYKSQEEIQAELDRTVEEGMFNISIASVIQFEDGTTPGTAYIENVPGNHYLMQVTITDDDTGDVLYESGVLKPNQYIENITLTKDLDPGTYDTTALFTALDEQTYDEIGHAAAKVTINVLG